MYIMNPARDSVTESKDASENELATVEELAPNTSTVDNQDQPDSVKADCTSNDNTSSDQGHKYSSYSIPTFTLEEITSSTYYNELANTAVTRKISFFPSFCRHRDGQRLSCLAKHFTKLSEDKKHYSFGRVLHLAMLWQEGMAYINGLNNEEVEKELQCCKEALSLFEVPNKKFNLLYWLKCVAQCSVNSVVSRLNSNSLDILNAMAGDEEAVIVSGDLEDYS